MSTQKEQFTKYEIARIIGARALQIAMDAPLLLKISEDVLKEINYDALKIAEKEFSENILPIAIHRPKPRKGKDKLGVVKEEKISDEELIEKAKEVEKEIAENPEEYSLVQEEETLDESSDTNDEK
jgi:DNA-directed RNA polymerase subunit K